MNALHTVGGLGKLAACRYLVDTVGMDVNMWDASPSNWPSVFLFFTSKAALLNLFFASIPEQHW
jgi:hypothetical protein